MVVPFVVRPKDIDLFESLDDLESETLLCGEDDVVAEDQDEAAVLELIKCPKTKSALRLQKFRANRHGDATFQSACLTLPEESSAEGLSMLPQPRSSSLSGATTSSSSSFSPSSPRCHKRRNRDRPRRSSISSSSSSASSICSKTFDNEDSLRSSRSSSTGSEESELSCTLSPVSTQGSRHSKKSSKACKRRLTRIKPKKSVSFTEMVRVQLIPDIDDYSSTERDQFWYSAKELTQIKVEAQALIQDAKNRRISATASELRGIHMTQKKQRRSNWASGLQCVLEEQEKLRGEVKKDRAAEKLARIYKSFAFTAMQYALKMAQEDALAAQES